MTFLTPVFGVHHNSSKNIFAVRNLFYYLKDSKSENKNEALSLISDLDYLEALKKIRGGLIIAYDVFQYGLGNIANDDHKSIHSLAEHLDFLEQDIELNVDDLIVAIKDGSGDNVFNLLKYHGERNLIYLRLLLVAFIKHPHCAEKMFYDNQFSLKNIEKLSSSERKYFYNILSKSESLDKISLMLSEKHREQQTIIELSKTNELLKKLYDLIFIKEIKVQISSLNKIFAQVTDKDCYNLYYQLPVERFYQDEYLWNCEPKLLLNNLDWIDTRLIALFRAIIIFDIISYLSKLFLSENSCLKNNYVNSLDSNVGSKMNIESIYSFIEDCFGDRDINTDKFCRNLYYLLKDEDYKYISLLIDNIEPSSLTVLINRKNNYEQFVLLRLLLDKAQIYSKINKISFGNVKWDDFLDGRENESRFMIYLSETYKNKDNSVVNIELPVYDHIKSFIDHFRTDTFLIVERHRDGDDYLFHNKVSKQDDSAIRKELKYFFQLAYILLLDSFNGENLELIESFLNTEIEYESSSTSDKDDKGGIKLSQIGLNISSINDISIKCYEGTAETEIIDSTILQFLYFNINVWRNELFLDRIKQVYGVRKEADSNLIHIYSITYERINDDLMDKLFDKDKYTSHLNKIFGKNLVFNFSHQRYGLRNSSEDIYIEIVSDILNKINKILNSISLNDGHTQNSSLLTKSDYSIFYNLNLDNFKSDTLLEIISALDFYDTVYLCPILVSSKIEDKKGLAKYCNTVQNQINLKHEKPNTKIYSEVESEIDLAHDNRNLTKSEITTETCFLTDDTQIKLHILFSEPSFFEIISSNKDTPSVQIEVKKTVQTIQDIANEIFEEECEDNRSVYDEFDIDDDGHWTPKEDRGYSYYDANLEDHETSEAWQKKKEINLKISNINSDPTPWLLSIGFTIKRLYNYLSPQIVDLLYHNLVSQLDKQTVNKFGIMSYEGFTTEENKLHINMAEYEDDKTNDYEKKLNYYFNKNNPHTFKKAQLFLSDIADELAVFHPQYFEEKDLYETLKNNLFCKPIRDGILNSLNDKKRTNEFVREEFYIKDIITPEKLGEQLRRQISLTVWECNQGYSESSSSEIMTGDSFDPSSRFFLRRIASRLSTLPTNFYKMLISKLTHYYNGEFSNSFLKNKFDRYLKNEEISSINQSLIQFFNGKPYNIHQLLDDEFICRGKQHSENIHEISTVIKSIEQSIQKFCDEKYFERYYPNFSETVKYGVPQKLELKKS